MRQLTLVIRKRKKLSENKSNLYDKRIIIIVFMRTTKEHPWILKSFAAFVYFLEKKTGRKSHRYEKKRVFDILGVVYDYMCQKFQGCHNIF